MDVEAGAANGLRVVEEAVFKKVSQELQSAFALKVVRMGPSALVDSWS